MSQIERFTFEAIPEKYTRASTIYPYGLCAPVPMFRISVTYGGEHYNLTIPAYNDQTMISESYLEHFIRRAVEEFKAAVRKEAADKANAKVEAVKAEAVKAIDELAKVAKRER